MCVVKQIIEIFTSLKQGSNLVAVLPNTRYTYVCLNKALVRKLTTKGFFAANEVF